MSLEFIITTLVVILLPGTGMLYTMAIGLARGFKMSCAAAFGCTLGILPAATASILGLAAIFHTSALAFQIIKYLGAVYLLYMAWSILKTGGALEIDERQSQTSIFKIATTGTLINVLNPKLSLFFLAFLPQFIEPSKSNGISAIPEMISLAAIFMLLTFMIFALYGACAALLRDYVVKRPEVFKWIKRSFAGTFGILSIKLALSEQ
jgi:threonine/homoserine/homoserine lactone efflux protein